MVRKVIPSITGGRDGLPRETQMTQGDKAMAIENESERAVMEDRPLAGIGDNSDIIDLEVYAKEEKEPPKGTRYRIRIDKNHYIVEVSQMTGREILKLAGKEPPERFRLDMKLKGGATRKIELEDVVDFTTPGIERFMTLPLDQTEG